jgi:transcriptional regulator with XRE-family HTH domain
LGRKPIDVIVGERLAALRFARSVSAAQLASVLGISAAELAAYEAGSTRVTPAHLIEICRYFEVTLQSLFPGPSRDHDPHLH